MTGYTKLFGSIIASTIWRESKETKIVWITMLAMANKFGVVEATIPGLAHFANVTLPECEEALRVLTSPDPYSRTKDHAGRRIEAIDGGWHLLNHGKYRAKMSADDRREYLRLKQQERRRKQSVCQHGVNNRQQMSTLSTHAEAEAEAIGGKQSPRDLASLADWQLDKDLARASKDYATQRDVKPRDKELFAYASGRLKALKAEKRRRASSSGQLGILLAKNIAPVAPQPKPAPAKPKPEDNGTFAGVNGERWKELARQAAEAVDRPGWAKESL